MKEGIRGIFLHGFMSFAAVCVTVACLLIVGSFTCLIHNVNTMVQELNQTNQILAFINDELPDEDAKGISTQFVHIKNIHKAEFVSREKALEEFVKDYDDAYLFDSVDPTLLAHRYVITLENNELMQETIDQLNQIKVGDKKAIVKINAHFELAEGFSTLQNVLHIASIAIIAVLLIVSLLIISNTVKLAMYDRRDEISIMKMVGATNGFIRLPFVVEGFALGMIGAAIAFGLEWLMYDALTAKIAAMDTLQLFDFAPFTDLLPVMIATFVGAGLFVGIVGSWTSIRKFMDV